MRLVTVILALLVTGCAFQTPGFSVAAFGTVYSHREYVKGNPSWETSAFRSWGTSRFNTLTNMSSERIGIEGEGISDNMAHLAEVLGDKALCAVPAIAPGCVFENGIGVFQGDDRSAALRAALAGD